MSFLMMLFSLRFIPGSKFASSFALRPTYAAHNSLKRLQSTLSEDQISVVSTASQGIGFEFTQRLLKDQSTKVIGLHRSSEANKQLLELKEKYPDRLSLVRVDLEDQQSVEEGAKQIQQMTSKIDLLLNVAGILGDGGVTTPGPERSIANIDRAWLHKSLEVNLVGHVMMTQALMPLLKRKSKKEPVSKVVSLTARVGSISDNRLGGWYSYRMSKAGMNMFTKTLSLEAKRHNCVVVSMHPGTTDTGLSKPFQANVSPDKLFTTEYSVSQMLAVVRGLDLTHAGGFYAYDGSSIPY